VSTHVINLNSHLTIGDFMAGQKVGYVRVSSLDQNTARQLDGLVLDKTFVEKISGKNMNRPILLECLSYVRHGDTLYVHSIDRLARNALDLLNLVEQILAKSVKVIFVKNNLIFSSESNDHMAKLQLTMLAAFAEFERSLIRERQKEGIAIAKINGKYSGRRKIIDEQIEEARRRTSSGEPLSLVAKDLKLSRQSLYMHGINSTLPFKKPVS
jgi:DNA invertase Pin-like site-specific DNA recombinase